MRRSWHFLSTVLGIIFRHPVTGAVIIPRLANGDIVLIRRRDSNLWGLPGGIVNWGEDIPTTVQRELQEETGLELVKISRLVGVYSAANRDPRLHSIAIVVEVQVQGIPTVQDNLEVIEVKNFHPDALPSDLSHDHTRQLKDYLAGITQIA